MNQAVIPAGHGFGSSGDILSGATLLSAAAIAGEEVCNTRNEKLGRIQDVMLDLSEGRIRYAVLAPSAFPEIGDRLFAVPWRALKQDRNGKRFTLDVDLERLKNAPGFARDHWPDSADVTWHLSVEYFYAR